VRRREEKRNGKGCCVTEGEMERGRGSGSAKQGEGERVVQLDRGKKRGGGKEGIRWDTCHHKGGWENMR
jgi:hypothetical protein